MSRLLLTAVVVFLAAEWLCVAASVGAPAQPPPGLPPIITLTGETPATVPGKPPGPGKPGVPPPPPAPPKAITVEMLLAQLRDTDAQKRLAAAEALARSNTQDPSAIDRLASALNDPDPQVRGLVVITLGHTQNKAALEPLMTATKDEQFSVRADAVRALLELGGDTALPALATVLKTGDENVRIEVAHTLGQLKDARALPVLAEALRDPQPPVAIEAAAALGELGDLRALRPLAAAMKNADLKVRREAVRAVRRLGSAGEDEADLAFRQKLERHKIARFKVDGVEFSVLLQFLRETGGMNLHVRWKPLAARKIRPTTPVTASPLLPEPDGVLTEFLLAADPAGEVAWIIQRGVVIVSTVTDLEACACARTLCGEIPCAGGPKDLDVRRQLGLRLPKVDCTDTALPAFVQSLQEAMKVEFRVNWEALKAFDVTQESKVSVVLADVAAERVLRLALHDLESSGKIGFGVKDGAVLITSAAELAPLRQPAAPPLITPPAPVPAPSPQR